MDSVGEALFGIRGPDLHTIASTRFVDRLRPESVTDAGGRAVAHQADVTDEPSVEALMARAVDEFGAICALFCSQQAGYIVGQNLVVDGGVTTATF